MNLKKHVPVLLAAATAAAVLLLTIFWSQSPHTTGQGRLEPTGGSGGPTRILPGATHPAAVSTETGHQVYRFEAPDEWYVAGAMSETYTATLSGEGFRGGEGDVYLGQSPPGGPYLAWYVVGRAYPGWDTSGLPDGVEILSATLVIELPAGGGREKDVAVDIYRAAWSAPLDLDDWLSPGAAKVGRWMLPASRLEERDGVDAGQGASLYATEPAHVVRVALDPAVVDRTGITRLELRHAGEGTPPAAANVVLLGKTMITLEVECRP